MAILGAHMSIAGGLEKAIEAAVACQMDTVQIFTKNNNRWEGKPLTDDQVERWCLGWKASGLQQSLAHASYLINLAAPDATLWEKSVLAMIDELERAERLQLSAVVVHPGAYTTSTEAEGLQRVMEALERVLGETANGTVRLLLENTAGQGTCLGWSIEHLATLCAGVSDFSRLGVCFDTCHAFAAGYDITTRAGVAELHKKVNDLLPEGAVRAVHANDSKSALGKRVDRHEHIGRGHIGDNGFRLILGDDLFCQLPMYLETPKGIDEETGEDWDLINLRRLRLLTS